MGFLQLLEQIRTPVGDLFFSLFTHLGAETLFMVVALVFFWCIDKKRGYCLLFTGFTGTVCIQILKMAFRIPRPWEFDPSFTIVESAREGATGYSFPSGHTQISTDLYGSIARSTRRRIVRIVSIVIAILVAFSRMYLGVHTPLDVGVSMLIGIALVFGFYPLIYRAYDRPKLMYITIAAVLALTLANLLFVMLFPFPADVDSAKLADAQKVAWQFFFLVLGLCIIYPLDSKVIKFDTRAVWWVQLIKLSLGLVVVILLRFLLKAPFNALFGVNLGSGLRYFCIVLFGGILWPMTFPLWRRLEKKRPQK